MKLIMAISTSGIIGTKTGLAWHIPEDLKRFAEKTKGKTCLVGSITYRTLRGLRPVDVEQSVHHPLPGRKLVVVGNVTEEEVDGNQFISTREGLEEALYAEDGWVIGGGELALSCLPWIDEVRITVVPDRMVDQNVAESDLVFAPQRLLDALQHMFDIDVYQYISESSEQYLVSKIEQCEVDRVIDETISDMGTGHGGVYTYLREIYTGEVPTMCTRWRRMAAYVLEAVERRLTTMGLTLEMDLMQHWRQLPVSYHHLGRYLKLVPSVIYHQRMLLQLKDTLRYNQDHVLTTMEDDPVVVDVPSLKLENCTSSTNGLVPRAKYHTPTVGYAVQITGPWLVPLSDAEPSWKEVSTYANNALTKYFTRMKRK